MKVRVSIHAPREGCDFGARLARMEASVFQFTHPGRGATDRNIDPAKYGAFQFTHPGRGATGLAPGGGSRGAFQFTHPGRGATGYYEGKTCLWKSFNSRTPGGVRLGSGNGGMERVGVSIHAPREGCDSQMYVTNVTQRQVSIHAPREGCDRRGERTQRRERVSIHAPREGCDATEAAPERPDKPVSIHAPREGCDGDRNIDPAKYGAFQFTHPGRGATMASHDLKIRRLVSIHAPREGCDVQISHSHL